MVIRWSLRNRLLAVVLAALLPMLALLIYVAWRNQQNVTADANESALRLARAAAAHEQSIIEDAKRLLGVLAQLPEVRRGDGPACTRLMADLLRKSPFYANIGATRLKDGWVCSAVPVPPTSGPRQITPMGRQAIAAKTSVVSGYFTGRESGKPVVAVVAPWFDDAGTAQGIAFLGINLTWVSEVAAQAALPKDSVLVVIDPDGTVLAREPDPSDWVGRSLKDTRLFREMWSRQGEGTIQLPGLTGILPRLFAFTPLMNNGAISAFVAVGIPTAILFAPARRSLVQSVLGFAVIAGLAIAGVWVVGERLIVRPVKALSDATNLIAAGDREARVGLTNRTDELGQLTRDFDQMAAALDLRERELRDAERRAADARFVSVLEAAADGIISVDEHYRIIQFNRGAESMFGYSAAEALGRPLDMLLPADRVGVHDDHLRAFAASPDGTRHMSKRGEVAGRRKTGEEFPIEATISKTTVDRKITLMAIVRDVSDRKRAEKARQQSEANLHAITDYAPLGISVIQDSRRTFANPQAARLLGYTVEEFAQFSIVDLVHPDYRAQMLDLYRRRLAGEALPEVIEYVVLAKDGREVAIEGTFTPTTWDGRAAVMLFATDITERKGAQETLRRTQEELVQAQKMESIGQLAGGIAHDFNNLLTVVMGRADVALAHLEPGNPARSNLESIRAMAERAASLTKQLLAFSRRQLLQPRVLNVNEVLGDMSGMLRRVLGDDIQLSFRPEPALDSVNADPAQLELALVNLALNARDAMPQGGHLIVETANVEFDEEYARTHASVDVGRYVLIAVSDTGSGMPPEILSRIFEPFFTTKEVGKGTGLGLAAVHGTVKQSGGEIRVYSQPGLGTTFKIYLPRVNDAPGRSLAPAPAALPSGTETVLVVEDNLEVLAIACEVLERGGYTVLHALNAAEALALVDRHPGPIHLLVADVVMPGLSGPELATQLTAARPDLLVLHMSGYTASVLDSRGALGPRTWFLEKPFAPRTFASKVREVLDTR